MIKMTVYLVVDDDDDDDGFVSLSSYIDIDSLTICFLFLLIDF